MDRTFARGNALPLRPPWTYPCAMAAPRSRTFYELLCEISGNGPERVALVSRGEEVSYGDLLARASALAVGLRREGIARGDRIAVLLNNRREWLELFFATNALGATMVPFSTWSTRSELDFLIGDAGVRWIVALARLGERDFASDLDALTRSGGPRALERVIYVDGPAGRDAYPDLLASPDPALLPAPGEGASAGDTALILYTSGSSARPKAVPLRNFAAIENGFNIGERMGLGPEDTVFVPVPLFWSFGCINALPAILTHGAAMVLQELFEPGGALTLIESHRCSALYTLPAMTNALLAHPSFEPARSASLRTGLTIGTAQDLARCAHELGAASICNIYGSTETYGNCSVTPHDWPFEIRATCQGLPLPGVRIRVRDPETGAPCAADEIGALEVHGYLSAGYTGQSRVHNTEVFCEDGYFRTGDLGCLDRRGRLRFAGRSGEMIKRSGINVSPAEVEEVLQRHPDVGLAGVTGSPDPRVDEAIIAFVVLRPGAAATAEELYRHCKTDLSRYKLPDHIEVCTDLPLTPTGKLMRRELKEIASALPRAHA